MSEFVVLSENNNIIRFCALIDIIIETAAHRSFLTMISHIVSIVVLCSQANLRQGSIPSTSLTAERGRTRRPSRRSATARLTMIVLVGPRSRTEVFTCTIEVHVVDYTFCMPDCHSRLQQYRQDDEDVAEGDGEADETQRHQRPGHLPNSAVQSGAPS